MLTNRYAIALHRVLAACVCIGAFLIGTAQQAPVIQLARPEMPADSVVHTTQDRIAVGGRVLSSSEVMLFKVNTADVVLKDGGLFMHEVALEPGRNVVRIGAANKNGRKSFLTFIVMRDEAEVVEQPPVEAAENADAEAPLEAVPVVEEVIAPAGKAPVAVVPVPYMEDDEDGAAKPADPLEIRALIIAVGKHKFGADKNLQFPAKDAAAFYDFITSPDGLAADPKNVRLLVDENATREAIIGAMRDMMNAANSTDVFFLYFSGHGQTVDNGQEYYFFTHDTRANDQTSIASSALSRSELQSRLKGGKVKKKVLFLDACYSGMMASGGKSMGERREHLFQEMAGTDEALVVFTSSSDTEQSFEDETLDGGHGIFTYYLVKGLQGEADKARSGNKNGKVTVYELDRYLGDEVNARALATKDLPQRPKRECARCDDFPLSVTSAYDISTAAPKPAQEVGWTTPTPKVEAKPVPTPATSPSGRNYASYKLPPVPKEVYVPAENPRFLNAQVYANANGDKITFDKHHYAQIALTGILGGQVLSGPGKIEGIQIAFTDQAGDRLKEGFAMFSPDSSSMNVTLELKSGVREKYTLQRMGVAKREGLLGRRFLGPDGQVELTVHGVHYDDIAVSGHVNGTIIDAKGQIRGDVMMFVDERKDAYASCQLVLSDDWSTAQGVIAFGGGTRVPVRLERSYEGSGYEINNSIYTNSTNDQTINFHSQHYATIKLSGIVGEENILCVGTIKGEVISLNDDPKSTGYRPSKLVLSNKGQVLRGEVIFQDGNVVKVDMLRKK